MQRVRGPQRESRTEAGGAGDPLRGSRSLESASRSSISPRCFGSIVGRRATVRGVSPRASRAARTASPNVLPPRQCERRVASSGAVALPLGGRRRIRSSGRPAGRRARRDRVWRKPIVPWRPPFAAESRCIVVVNACNGHTDKSFSARQLDPDLCEYYRAVAGRIFLQGRFIFGDHELSLPRARAQFGCRVYLTPNTHCLRDRG